MLTLPVNDELMALAPRIIWFEKPEDALAKPLRFMAYLMTYGTPEDIAVVKKYVGEAGFQTAIKNAPCGILDERSWSYWNAMAGLYPPPPMPQRSFPD